MSLLIGIIIGLSFPVLAAAMFFLFGRSGRTTHFCQHCRKKWVTHNDFTEWVNWVPRRYHSVTRHPVEFRQWRADLKAGGFEYAIDCQHERISAKRAAERSAS